LAPRVHDAEKGLSFDVALIGGSAVPRGRLAKITRYALPVFVHYAQQKLGSAISGLCQRHQFFPGARIVPGTVRGARLIEAIGMEAKQPDHNRSGNDERCQNRYYDGRSFHPLGLI
jgi:hypothetical protein